MAYQKHVWGQIKNITSGELIKALELDSWALESSKGTIRVYIKNPEGKRVSVHHRRKKTFGRETLNGMLNAIDWSEEDLQRLKLIKAKKKRKTKKPVT